MPAAGALPLAPCLTPADQGRVSEFELKLMDITSENLGIPETEYSATVCGCGREVAHTALVLGLPSSPRGPLCTLLLFLLLFRHSPRPTPACLGAGEHALRRVPAHHQGPVVHRGHGCAGGTGLGLGLVAFGCSGPGTGP